MRPLIYGITTVLLLLATISTAIPAKTATFRFLRYEFLSNSWHPTENIQSSPYIIPTIRSRRFPTAEFRKAFTSLPGSDAYKGTSEAHVKSRKASISFLQFDPYMRVSKVVKSLDAFDLTHSTHSNVNSRIPVSRYVSLPFSVRQGGGLTGDKCTTNDDCQGDRVCSDDFGAGSLGLRCSFEGGAALICDENSDCDSGEVCVPNAGTTGSNLCLSSAFVEDTDGEPSPSPDVEDGGLTGENCTTTDDCQGDRVCNSNFADGLRCSFDAGTARICNVTDVCTVGEVCVPNAGTADASLCLSRAFVAETLSGLTGDNCTTTDDCQGERICGNELAGGEVLRCSFEGGAGLLCNATLPCTIGEACVPNSGSDGASLCLSAAFVEENLTGLTGERCTTTDDCRDNRLCSEDLGSGVRCSFEGGAGLICNETVFCPPGEVCVPNTAVDGSSLCFSNVFVIEAQRGRTGDNCTTTDDCQGGRICNEDIGNGLRCSLEGGGALLCNATIPCPIGEMCVPGIGTSGESACLSTEFAVEIQARDALGSESDGTESSPEPDEEGTQENGDSSTPGTGEDGQSEICIGAHLLQHISRDELIFEQDRLANVLCDANESCATPGHMVIYQGKGMMMKSYCELVGGCVEKIMRVNSPMYRKGTIVRSKSKDMAFSAFSARYVTRTEEGVLSMAMRLGF